MIVTQALKHPYFSNRPAPAPGSQLPRPGLKKEQETVLAGASHVLKRKLEDPFGGPGKSIFLFIYFYFRMFT